jgi:hypothetical protein
VADLALSAEWMPGKLITKTSGNNNFWLGSFLRYCALPPRLFADQQGKNEQMPVAIGGRLRFCDGGPPIHRGELIYP